MPTLDRRAVVIGAMVALLVCVPPAVVAQIMSDRDELSGSNWVLLLFGLILFGFLASGYAAGRHQPEAPLTHGGMAAFAAFALVQGVGVVRHVLTGDDLRWVGVVLTALLATSCGIVGGLLSGLLRQRGAA